MTKARLYDGDPNHGGKPVSDPVDISFVPALGHGFEEGGQIEIVPAKSRVVWWQPWTWFLKPVPAPVDSGTYYVVAAEADSFKIEAKPKGKHNRTP